MRLLIVLLLTACVTQGDNTVDPCGTMPNAPGYSVYFHDGQATMDAKQFTALDKWRNDVEVWRNCKGE